MPRYRIGGAPVLALIAAALFGITTPLASLLARTLSPLWLSGALYLGVAVLVMPALLARRRLLMRGDAAWFAGSALIGGVVAPVLLVIGLQHTDAASASLLLSAEPVATALIAWLVGHENANRRTVIGMVLIASGAALLAWRGSPDASLGSIAILGAACGWAIDNNLTARIVASDSVAVTGLKGLVAGGVSVALALLLRNPLPLPMDVGAGAAVGLVGYGLSLVLFLRALRALGAARTSAYLATAPFVGALASLALGAPADPLRLAAAGALMAAGVWLHASERHDHDHIHESLVHEHPHTHDDHHAHLHRPGDPVGDVHSHAHWHARLAHQHAHTPDVHHHHAHD